MKNYSAAEIRDMNTNDRDQLKNSLNTIKGGLEYGILTKKLLAQNTNAKEPLGFFLQKDGHIQKVTFKVIIESQEVEGNTPERMEQTFVINLNNPTIQQELNVPSLHQEPSTPNDFKKYESALLTTVSPNKNATLVRLTKSCLENIQIMNLKRNDLTGLAFRSTSSFTSSMAWWERNNRLNPEEDLKKVKRMLKHIEDYHKDFKVWDKKNKEK